MKPTNRQVDESVSEAERILIRHHEWHLEYGRAERLQAEVEVLAGWVLEWAWGEQRIERRIIEPLAVRLDDRFGQEVGPGLLDEFLVAFTWALFSLPSGEVGPGKWEEFDDLEFHPGRIVLGDGEAWRLGEGDWLHSESWGDGRESLLG